MDKLTDKILGCAVRVSKGLGTGFLEKVYENALCMELREAGLLFQRQHPISIWYRENVVGEYVTDLLVEQAVILELKAAKTIDRIHEAQLLNYLRATGVQKGLILNFGTPRLGIRRMVLTRPSSKPANPSASSVSSAVSTSF